MAIEDKIDALIAALDRNTAAHGGKASTAAGKAADAAIEKEATRAAAAAPVYTSFTRPAWPDGPAPTTASWLPARQSR